MKFGIILALAFALCGPTAALGGLSDNPQVIMETSKGTIVLEVFPMKRPKPSKIS